LSESARRQVTGVTEPLVVKMPKIGYVLQGGRTVEIAVSRKAPQE
jgi:hypothetical protein